MTTGMIFLAIPKIMAAVGAIGKERSNTAHGYKFRGVDDVYNALQQHLAEHKVFTVPEVLEDKVEERKTAKGTSLIYRVLKIKYTFYAEDGSSFSAVTIGEGMDSGDKASNKAMAVAHKYALLQVFCIPTEEPKDPENDSHEVVPKQNYEFAKYTGDREQQAKLKQLLAELAFKPATDLVIGEIHRALIGTPENQIRDTVIRLIKGREAK